MRLMGWLYRVISSGSALCCAVITLLVLCLISTPVTADQGPEDPVQQQNWRVVNDAPYRVRPAYLALTKTGETLQELGFASASELLSNLEKSSSVWSVAFSTDGRFLASGSNDKSVKLWDVQAQTLVHSFEGHTSWVQSVVFSPDGRFLASGSSDGSVTLWDVQAQTLVHSFEAHTSWVQSVVFSPDGRFLASGSSDGSVTLWDVQAQTLVHSFEGHTRSVQSVVFSPDGRFLASGSSDGSVTLWDVQAQTLVHSFEAHTRSVQSVAFSPDGRFLASGSSDGSVTLWDVQAQTLVHSFEAHTRSVLSVAFSPDGRFLASGSSDGSVTLWDVQAQTLVHSFEAHTRSVLSVAFSPDGRFLASGSSDGSVTLWDVQAQTLVHSFEAHTRSVQSVAFSPDGRFLASGSSDGSVTLWDVQAQTLVHSFEAHTRSVQSVAFSPDGRFLASGSSDGSVTLWDVQAQTLVHSFEGHTRSVLSVAFSPDGGFLASGSYDTSVKLWDVQAQTLVHSFEGHTSSVQSVAFSPDGRFLASGSSDGSVTLWDVQAQTLVHSFEAHTSLVQSVAFSPDGRFLASGSDDGSVTLWDVQAQSESHMLIAGHGSNWVSVDSQQRVFRGDDGTFLQKGATKQGNWQPVPVADMSLPDDFSISVLPESIKIQPGESTAVHIQVTNNGPHPAYWLHVKPSLSDDAVVRLDPPDRLFNRNGKGQQPWRPARIAKLEVGETATLHARVTVNLKLPAEFIKPGERPLVFTVVSANGTQVSQAININVQSPQLAWRTAELDRDGKTLKISLQNPGTVALQNFSLNLYADGVDEPLTQQTITELAPTAMTEIAVALPASLDLDSQPLTLQGRTPKLPIFRWALKAPEIERGSWLGVWLLAPVLLLTVPTLFYLRRFHHPLVVQLSEEPALILQLQPDQLTQARTRLEQTRRLETVLSNAQVTRKTLDEGITFFANNSPQEKADKLAQRIGRTVSLFSPADGQAEAVRLWEMRLPDDFPLNVQRCLVCFPSPDLEPQDLFMDLKKIPQTQMHATLLISQNAEYQRQLYEQTKDRTNKWVAPSTSELTHLLLSPTPALTLANLLADQLSLTQLSPYQVGGGVERESVFFGRQETIAHIMNRELANYLIVSGRQLGKSSVLKALERRYRAQPEVSCYYLALSNEVLIPRLASVLKLPRGAAEEEIAEHVAQQPGQFLFLIDEADKFVRHELKTDYKILDALRRMSEEGQCKFILAGFWELYEHAVLDYQSPLKNFAEIIQLGALEKEACRQLASEPMHTMQLAYANPTLVEQLLDTTGQRANLMAITCHEILSQLPPNQRVIETGEVQRALHSEKTLNALKAGTR